MEQTPLRASEAEMLECWAHVAEYREDPTGGHPRRVGYLAALLAAELGFSRPQVGVLKSAANLHDIGKVVVPDAILLKPDKLTPGEFEILKKHTTVGAHLLEGSKLPVLKLAQDVVLTHHEKWDGSGYPRGLAGQAIPRSGRIVALADVFDALTHNRPYRKAYLIGTTIELIKAERGTQFDPEVVDAFLRIVEDEEKLAAFEESGPTTSSVIETFLDASVKMQHPD